MRQTIREATLIRSATAVKLAVTFLQTLEVYVSSDTGHSTAPSWV